MRCSVCRESRKTATEAHDSRTMDWIELSRVLKPVPQLMMALPYAEVGQVTSKMMLRMAAVLPMPPQWRILMEACLDCDWKRAEQELSEVEGPITCPAYALTSRRGQGAEPLHACCACKARGLIRPRVASLA